jgi:hypothetical protein
VAESSAAVINGAMVGITLAPAPVRIVSAAPRQLRGAAGGSRANGVVRQGVKKVVLGDAVIDLLGDPQGVRQEQFRRIEITNDQLRAGQIEQHHLEAVEIPCLPAETHSLFGR